MKPKTKYQVLVTRLSKKLPKLKKEHTDWCLKKFENLVYKTKHTAVCFECGHGWKQETMVLSDKICGITCPSCHKELKVKERKTESYKDDFYMSIYTTCENNQVI